MKSRPLERHLFVVFGATGDLTSRKLLPALYHLVHESRVVLLGVGSSDMDDASFRAHARDALSRAGYGNADAWCDERVHFHRQPREAAYEKLAERIGQVEKQHELPGNRVLYLALPPSTFPKTIEGVGKAGLQHSPGWSRLVVEKPFGHDAESARVLNDTVHRYFEESQVYRIDHYLGKETVQNLLVFRFANPLFEASWNRDRVDRVEITVAEAIDIGRRGGYYDGAGAVRDMIQSHLAQLLTLVAMEPPISMKAPTVRDEKVKVLRSMRPVRPEDTVLGQYTTGAGIPAYRSLDGVDADSTTPTYAAMKLFVDNWRWQGVPFYLRTGKAMAERTTQIAVAFRPPPVCLFHGIAEDCPEYSDVLYLNIQPDEGFRLEIEVKEPGETPRLRTVPLRFDYAEAFGEVPEAYEALLRDIIEGDQTHFVRSDWVEESWRIFAPILDAELPVHEYPAGSWGPTAARDLLGDAPNWATGS